MLFPYAGLAGQMMHMALQAPLVMAARMGDWMVPMVPPSARTRREASRMVLEKQAAAVESWAALGHHALQAWAQCLLGQPLSPAQIERAGRAVLAPYARRVDANAARLGRRRH